jgi:hypothetical protein
MGNAVIRAAVSTVDTAAPAWPCCFSTHLLLRVLTEPLPPPLLLLPLLLLLPGGV